MSELDNAQPNLEDDAQDTATIEEAETKEIDQIEEDMDMEYGDDRPWETKERIETIPWALHYWEEWDYVGCDQIIWLEPVLGQP